MKVPHDVGSRAGQIFETDICESEPIQIWEPVVWIPEVLEVMDLETFVQCSTVTQSLGPSR